MTLERRAVDRLQSEGLLEALSTLDPRSRRIIEARWLADDSGATLHDLAAEFGVSAERIRQIEAKALGKMKTALHSGVVIDG
ncbi:RNA polymerase sigma factor RpoH [compost metagenome]